MQSPPNIEFGLLNIEISEKDKEKSILESQVTKEATVPNFINITGNGDTIITRAIPGGGDGRKNPTPLKGTISSKNFINSSVKSSLAPSQKLLESTCHVGT